MKKKDNQRKHEKKPVRYSTIEANTLEYVVEKLCNKNEDMPHLIHSEKLCYLLPSRNTIVDIFEDFRSILFPGYFGVSDLNEDTMYFYIGSTLEKLSKTLQEQIMRGFCFECKGDLDVDMCLEYEKQAWSVSKSFLQKLPFIREVLSTDVKAAYEGDPAATSPYEIIFCYPGFLAVTNYRLAHELYLLDVPLIPRIITEYAHSVTGIDIHPGAEIDKGFFIDHGTGVVIGETAIIGKNVRIYQGVTLGAKSFPLDKNGKPVKGIDRHPIVEDDVIIYSGATILGRVTIGKGSAVGGNVWLTHSVPPGSRIAQAGVREKNFQNGEGI